MPMNARTLLFTEMLQNALKQDRRFVELASLEANIQKEEGIAEISKKMNEEAEVFSSARQYHGVTSDEAKNAAKNLYLTKTRLEELSEVKSYLEAFREVSSIYFSLNEILFSDVSMFPFGDKHD